MTIERAWSVEGFHHVQLAMPPGREDDAEAFYAGVLGFDVVPKPEHLAARGGRWFRSGVTELHLGVEEGFAPSAKAHPATAGERARGAARGTYRQPASPSRTTRSSTAMIAGTCAIPSATGWSSSRR